jgi:hypothetical protein
MDEEHIQEGTGSRGDLSACNIDGISYRIFKEAKREGIEVLKQIIKVSSRCERVMTTWKEARTILRYKKGDRNVVTNWPPISMANCI